MRCYKVIAKDGDDTVAFRFAGTSADARTTRDELVESTGLKKKNVEIEQTEVPVAKAELIGFLNEMATQLDLVEESEE